MNHALIPMLMAIALAAPPVLAETTVPATGKLDKLQAPGQACKHGKHAPDRAPCAMHAAGQPCAPMDARLAAMEKRLDAIQATLEQLVQSQTVKKP